MTTLLSKAQAIIEASKPQGFMNLVKSETIRPRRDGLTTNLINLARKMNYRFVVASKTLADHLPPMDEKPVIASANDFRGMSGGFIWDHYSVAQVCWEMVSAFDRLKKDAADITKAYQADQEKIAKLEAQLKVAVEGLNAVLKNCSELQPNSGHMYLANVNYCYRKTKDAIARIQQMGKGE